MLMIILICVTFGLWAWCRRNGNKDEPPVCPGSLPIIGHAHLLFGDSVQLWNGFKEFTNESLKAGGVISASIGPKTAYVISDPEDFLTVANTCLEKDSFYEFTKAWLGEGLITGTVSIWKEHRKLLNPAFSHMVLDGFLDVFNKQSRRLVKDLEKEVGKGPFDHWVYTRHNALETICLTAIGLDFTDKTMLNSQYVNATEQMLNALVSRFQKFWLHNNFIFSWSSLRKKQDGYLKILHNVSNTILKKRKANYFNNKNNQKNVEKIQGLKFKPFMDLLLELAIEKGAFNDREIREHVDTIITSGHDTSASVLMYSMLLVGSYPHVQERIFKELNDVFGDDDRDVTKQDLSQLFYLEAVLKESMRLYPILPFIIRHLDKNVKLRNCTLTKGRSCFLFVYGVHRHSMWGPDAEEFKPERWLDPASLPKCPTAFAAFSVGRRNCIGNCTLTKGRSCFLFVYGVHRHSMWGPDAEEFKPERWLDPASLPKCPTAFAAFSVGRRNCIGKSYAYMSMKTTLAHLYRHYRVKGDHTKLNAKLDVMLRPVSGYYITIEKRKK